MTFDKIKDLEKDDLLNLLGLESRRTAVDYLAPGLALLGVGLLIGTGIGLLVAPRKGSELREDIAKRIQEVPEAMSQLPRRANEALQRASDQMGDKHVDGKVS